MGAGGLFDGLDFGVAPQMEADLVDPPPPVPPKDVFGRYRR